MPIRVKCRSCSKVLAVKDTAAGKTLKCPECGEPVRVPRPKPPEEEEYEEYDEYDDAEYEAPQPRRHSPAGKSSGSGGKKKSSRKSNPTPLIIGGAIGGVVVIGIIVAVLMSGGNGDGDAGGDGTVAASNGADGANSSGAASSGNGSGSPVGSADSPTAGSSAVGVAGSSVVAAPDAPFGWPLTADASALPWGETTRITSPDAVMGMTYPNAPTAAVALGFGATKVGLQGSRSINLATGEQIGSIDVVTTTIGSRTLSPDGTTVAFIHQEGSEKHQVTVWSYATGQKIQTIDAEQPGQKVSSLTLTSPDRLLTFSDQRIDGKQQRLLKLFDATTGAELKRLAFENVFDLTHCTISPGGKYLAYLIDTSNLLIIDVGSLAVVAAAKFANSPIYRSSGVAFNSKGDRIACGFVKDSLTRIEVVDFATGKPSAGGEFIGDVGYSPITGAIYLGTSLEWIPGDTGWCVSGSCIVDAKSGKAVWFIDSTAQNGSQRRRPAPDGLLVPAGSLIDRQLTLIPVPWSSIRSSIAAADNDTSALLRKGSSVSVLVEVGALSHGDATQTTAALKESLTKRLVAEGLTVADGSAITVYAHYSEKAGHMAQNMLDRNQQVQTTNSLIKLEWRGSGGTPLRTLDLTVNPHLVRVKEFSAAAYRDAVFEKAIKQIDSCQFPYYIPSGSDQQSLPGLTIF
jgi:WD40 repeat protein/phage FluMu protein Com